jgi:hypothetical protein
MTNEEQISLEAAHARYSAALAAHVASTIDRLKLELACKVSQLDRIVEDLDKCRDRLPPTAIELEF